MNVTMLQVLKREWLARWGCEGEDMLEKAAETTPATIGEYYFLFLISHIFLFLISLSFSSLFLFLPFLSVLLFID